VQIDGYPIPVDYYKSPGMNKAYAAIATHRIPNLFFVNIPFPTVGKVD
jgi:hypothetical protein